MFIHFAPSTWQEREYDDRSTPLATIDPDIDTGLDARLTAPSYGSVDTLTWHAMLS